MLHLGPGVQGIKALPLASVEVYLHVAQGTPICLSHHAIKQPAPPFPKDGDQETEKGQTGWGGRRNKGGVSVVNGP